MEPLNLALVGCGLMGMRHLRGYAELERVRPGSLRLRAVCDPRQEVVQRAAAEAESLLGGRPAVYQSAQDAMNREPDIEAADVAVQNRLHDAVAVPLLEAGLNVLLEKPLATTIERGRKIMDAAARAGRLLAVAENNRRDPINRLLAHAIRAGSIGTPHYVLQTQVGGGPNVLASPWRHATADGGLLLDIGIHQAYVLEMLLGPIGRVHARTQRVWDERLWHGETIPVESDDVFSAILEFESGAQGVWMLYLASIGRSQWQRSIFGDVGSLDGPPDRSGQPAMLHQGRETLKGDELVAALPDFHLNEVESLLFGEKPGSYELDGAATDRKLIAAEVADFADAVRNGRPPEVPGELGLHAVAVAYAVLESAASGSPVRVREVLDGKIRAVQDRVEEAATQNSRLKGPLSPRVNVV